MIRHLVLFTLNPGTAAADDRVAEALAASRALGTSPFVRRWQVAPNISDRDVAADFAAVGDFAGTDHLDRFLASPAHVAAGGLWAALATWSIADYHL